MKLQMSPIVSFFRFQLHEGKFLLIIFKHALDLNYHHSGYRLRWEQKGSKSLITQKII